MRATSNGFSVRTGLPSAPEPSSLEEAITDKLHCLFAPAPVQTASALLIETRSVRWAVLVLGRDKMPGSMAVTDTCWGRVKAPTGMVL